MSEDIIVKIEQPEEMAIAEELPEIAIIEEKLEQIADDKRFDELWSHLENEYKESIRAIILEEILKFSATVESRLAGILSEISELRESRQYFLAEMDAEPEPEPEPEIIEEVEIVPEIPSGDELPVKRGRFFI